tara:strand:+ start:10798 stop:11358 length:561 start_codon:yes stop_codon:yes gene_type:complete
MRIIAGLFRGSSLYQPIDKQTRPLKDITRESIFNLLLHSKKISVKLCDNRVLDIFSGTGSFGIECISRGAKEVTFIEKYEPVIKVLEKNINKLKIQNQCSIIKKDFFDLKTKNLIKPYDFIFIDPPFGLKNMYELINIIIKRKLLTKYGIIIIHRHKKSLDTFPDLLVEIEQRVYGNSKITFLTLT